MKRNSKLKSKLAMGFNVSKAKMFSKLRSISKTTLLECFWILFRAAPKKLQIRVGAKIEEAPKRKAVKRKAAPKRKAPKRKTSKTPKKKTKAQIKAQRLKNLKKARAAKRKNR